MKGLKIIPVFIVLLVCTYVGILFVEANRDEVIVRFLGHETPSSALGLVVLTSVLLGMVISGALCSVELLVLMMQNRSLKRRTSQGTPLEKRGGERRSSEATGSFNLEPLDTSAEISETGEGKFTPL